MQECRESTELSEETMNSAFPIWIRQKKWSSDFCSQTYSFSPGSEPIFLGNPYGNSNGNSKQVSSSLTVSKDWVHLYAELSPYTSWVQRTLDTLGGGLVGNGRRQRNLAGNEGGDRNEHFPVRKSFKWSQSFCYRILYRKCSVITCKRYHF